MSNPIKLPYKGEASDSIRCIVETPRGSRAKFRFDPETKMFMLSKSLVTGLSYPYDWGFVPSTIAEDGDPIDVMLLHDVSTYPGMMVYADLIGVLEVNDLEGGKKTPNPRLFAVPLHANREHAIDDVRRLSERIREELERFFEQTAALERKQVECVGWQGPKRASELLEEAAHRYRKDH
jgi:inorganic pyrophosphatase